MRKRNQVFSRTRFQLNRFLIPAFLLLEQQSENKGFRRLKYLLLHAEKMIVLVVLYSINNILSYVALGKVDAALYTVLSQVKAN
jgi:hypothetical protein